MFHSKKEASRELKLDHQKGCNTADTYKGRVGLINRMHVVPKKKMSDVEFALLVASKAAVTVTDGSYYKKS